MTDIVKILSLAVDVLLQRFNVAYAAHRFANTLQNFVIEYESWSSKRLKIRVSAVRFCPRPPLRTVVLLCRTAVFLFVERKSLVAANAAATLRLRCCDFAL